MRSDAWRRAEHVEMILVAAHAAADHAQQLVLQPRHLRGDVGELVEGHFAHVRGGQRDRIAAVDVGTERIQADQLAGQVEADDAFLAVLADRRGLEGAVARHVHRFEPVAHAEQGFAARDGPAAAHDRIQLPQAFRRRCPRAGTTAAASSARNPFEAH